MLNLYESFLHIVTGIEDLDDTKEGSGALDAVADRIDTRGGVTAGHNEAMNSMPTSPQQAVGGLYLELEPRLRVRRTESRPEPATAD